MTIRKVRQHCVHAYFFINNAINAYRLRRINHKRSKRSDDRLTILFICQVPSLWNSMKPVFEEALRRDIQVHVLAVPEKRVKKNYSVSDEDYDENKAYAFCKRFYDQVIDAYDAKKRRWVNIKKLKPDYVFFPRPYEIYLPKVYRSGHLVRYTKLCYVNYAYNFEDYADKFIYKKQFIKNIYMLFPESKFSEESINTTRKENHIDWNKVNLFGYPRFSLLPHETARDADTLRVLWTPRWTTNKDVCASHFFEYKDRLFSFMKDNARFELIFRPHPLLFRNFLSTGELSADDYQRLLQEINAAGNISLDESGDYIESFSKSDVLITDTSGLVIDYYVTGKPIIFCGNKEDFSEHFAFLYDSLYDGSSWENIVKTLQALTKSDVLFDERNKNISRISPFSDIAKNMLDCLEKDNAAAGRDL